MGKDGNPPADYRGIWSWPATGSFYLHIETPNSSVTDCLRSHECPWSPSQPPCRGTCSESAAVVTARSNHPDGVNVVFADAHVDFYEDVVDLPVWQALATIAGLEVISRQQ